MKNAFLLFTFCLLALAASPALSAEPAAENPAPVCTLKNTEFCGVWKPIMTADLPGGNLTLQGNRFDWENGDHSECSILSEERRGDRIFSVLKCTETFFDGTQGTPKFIMLYFPPDPLKKRHPDLEPLFGVTDCPSLSCLFAEWGTEKTYDDFFKDYACDFVFPSMSAYTRVSPLPEAH